MKLLRPVPLFCFVLTFLFLFQACTAQSSTDKPSNLVCVEFTSSDCTNCREIHRIMQKMQSRYGLQITFVTLDMSSSSQRLRSAENARGFHGDGMVRRYQDRPGTVAVLNALNGQKIQMLRDVMDEADYVSMLDAALSRVH